jgi:hypothetical protein
MEMTRRKFIHKLVKASSAIAVGASWLISKATPRKFIWAARVKKYPGPLKPLGDISKQGKWSG